MENGLDVHSRKEHGNRKVSSIARKKSLPIFGFREGICELGMGHFPRTHLQEMMPVHSFVVWHVGGFWSPYRLIPNPHFHVIFIRYSLSP